MSAYINLLPPEDRKKAMSFRQGLLLLGAIAYILLLCSVYLISSYQLKEMRMEKDGLANQLKVAQPSLEKLHKLEQEQKALEVRLQDGKNLTQETFFSELLVLIAGLTPENVTLTRLSYSTDNIAFEGESRDYRGIAEMIANLKNSARFTDVELISSFTNKRSDGTIGFRISGKLIRKG